MREGIDPEGLEPTWWKAPIDLVLEKLISKGNGEFDQDESKCDGAIIDAVKRARSGDFLGLSTLDGEKIASGSREGEAIIEALGHAIDTGANCWLFIFHDKIQKASPKLLEIGGINLVYCHFDCQDGVWSLRMEPKGGEPTSGLSWTPAGSV